MDSDHAPGWRAYAWGAIAVVACPCNIPLLIAVLAGTTTGAILAEHWEITAFILSILFLLALSRKVRVFQHRSWLSQN